MNFKQITSLTVLAAASLLSMGAQAVTLTQWDFNASNVLASTGSGTASLIGGTTATFASGSGSSDSAAAASNKAWNTTNYAAVSAGDKTRGVEFEISTLGFEDIVFSYDSKHSGSASKNEQVQYSVNGGAFVDSTVFTSVDTNFSNLRMVDLSGVTATDNIASLRLRVVSTFATPTSYVGTTSTYGTSGTMRFDMVTFAGTAVTAVPEPSTYALLLAGLGAVGFVARRRKV